MRLSRTVIEINGDCDKKKITPRVFNGPADGAALRITTTGITEKRQRWSNQMTEKG